VFVASCLERAMALFRDNKERIQVLITDLVMPELFGDQFAMKLLAENPKLRVIVMSGNTPDLLQTAFPLKEGENFIRKPFRPADLLRLIVD
jgi:FixJ family two-component response regulator